MLIAVASDAHGARRHMDALLDALPRVDAFCFLGDMDSDAQYLDWGLREVRPGVAFYAVAGNNDPFSQRARSVETVFDGVRTLITHGHIFQGIRATQMPMALQAKQMGCALVLYGHTHIQKDEVLEGVCVVNPGALMHGKWALLDIREGGISVEMNRVSSQ